MRERRETLTGWAVSLGLHGALLFLLLLLSVPEIIQEQEFIEVVWGIPALAEPSQPAPSIEAPKQPGPRPEVTAAAAPAQEQKPSQPVFLPERRLPDPSDESLPVVRSEKITPDERPGLDRPAQSDVGDRDVPTTTTFRRDQSGSAAAAPGASVGPASGTGGPGLDVEKGVSFSIQWMEGGTRRKISGDLPVYPEGVNVVAQIKILAVVTPEGSVKSTQPAQKAHTKLEEVAMKEVRLWKFEPLKPSQPQSDQSCIVTFLFTLK